MNILDLFYNEILKEASLGEINAYFTYNIMFETLVDNKEYRVSKDPLEPQIPTLRITDKKTFDMLLVEYYLLARDFYDKQDESMDEKDYAKSILALLFSNATFEDFNNPCGFLKKRIDFINNSCEQKYDLGYSKTLKCDLNVSINKDKIFNETPYQFSLTAHKDDKLIYTFPNLKFGISDGKAYVYAIQMPNVDNSKGVNRSLYKVNEGFDSSVDNYEIFDLGNLSDITPNFLLVVNAFVSYAHSLGIKEVIVPSILIERWNAKKMANDKRYRKGVIDEDTFLSIEEKQDYIQSNLTEKHLRTFLRLNSHYPNISTLSYPMESDECLHVDISNLDCCNNKLLEEVRDLVIDGFSKSKLK